MEDEDELSYAESSFYAEVENAENEEFEEEDWEYDPFEGC